MIYVIDGNNVMGQRVGWHRDRPGSRRRLAGDVARLCRTRQVGAVLVFDGSPVAGEDSSSGPVATVGEESEMRILFAGPDSNADDRIVELAATVADPADLLAVTSDRELRKRLAARGVRTIRSGEFRRLLAV